MAYDKNFDRLLTKKEWRKLLADHGISGTSGVPSSYLDQLYDTRDGSDKKMNRDEFVGALSDLFDKYSDKEEVKALYKKLITPYEPSSDELEELKDVWLRYAKKRTGGRSMTKGEFMDLTDDFNVVLMTRYRWKKYPKKYKSHVPKIAWETKRYCRTPMWGTSRCKDSNRVIAKKLFAD